MVVLVTVVTTVAVPPVIVPVFRQALLGQE
jgi:hypothetical protein